MTLDDIRAAIAADPQLVAAVHAALAEQIDATPHWQAIADAVSAVAPPMLVERYITDRGVIDALGTDTGDAALTALETAASATLPEGDPLAPHQGGLRRMLAWMQREPGLDIGTVRAQAMLDTLAALGRMDAAHAAAIKALAQRPDVISELDIRRAVLADDGAVRV